MQLSRAPDEVNRVNSARGLHFLGNLLPTESGIHQVQAAPGFVWKPVTSIVDSGAINNVAPSSVSAKALVESDGSLNGMTYHTADGTRSFQLCSSPEVRSTERSEPISPMGDAQDHKDMREDEEDLFGEEDFEGSEEAKELPNVTPKCHKKPTVSEIVAHNRSHTPYSPNFPHRPRRPDQGALKNEIAADYCFLRNAARGVSQPVLVARDQRTGIYIAHAVPFKGAGVEWIAKQFRTDGEPAILDLMGEGARLRVDLPTVLEHGGQFDQSRT